MPPASDRPTRPGGEPSTVSVRAAAKINVYLGVAEVGADGFHPLHTVFQSLDRYDTVTVQAEAGDEPGGITLTGPETAGVPSDARNLAWRAAELVALETGGRHSTTRLRLSIDKQIPAAGGLAGGSADAAATLLALTALWNLELTAARLATLAGSLGSDVPFCLLGGTAIGVGRGDQLTPVPSAEFHWVLAAAHEGLSTPAVYAELDRQRERGTSEPPAQNPEAVVHALATGDVDALAPLLANDLQPAAIALAPALAETLDAGLHLGALGALVSGSGPTCAFLTAGPQAATELAVRLAEVSTVRRTVAARGPAAGAHLITGEPS